MHHEQIIEVVGQEGQYAGDNGCRYQQGIASACHAHVVRQRTTTADEHQTEHVLAKEVEGIKKPMSERDVEADEQADERE